jgi:hypothetical protein
MDPMSPQDTSIDQEEIGRLRNEIERLQTELVVAVIAAEEAEGKAESYLNHLVQELVVGPGVDGRPVPKGTIQATISQARQVARHVLIPVSSEQSIEVLDRTEVSNVWARDLGQVLGSLERYAYSVVNAGFEGDFLAWIKQKGDYSAQKIAMKESESVMNDPDLRVKRVFKVSDSLDVTGQKLMQAHAKIQIRGGGQIPRVYFFDDTKGSTRKVHIGFIGPHYLVPSASF